jgi:hypothetical protein
MSGIIMYQALEEQKADDLERMKLELLRKDDKLIQIENQMQEFMLMALDIMKWIHYMLP